MTALKTAPYYIGVVTLFALVKVMTTIGDLRRLG